MNAGDPCEVKLTAGLGGWRSGATIVGRSLVARMSYEVMLGGVKHIVPESRVRPSRRVADKPLAAETPVRKPEPQVREWARYVNPSDTPAMVRELVATPKIVPARSQSYLDFVRGKRCCGLGCSAGAPSEAHHYGPHGTGTKTSDYRTVPVCRACHQSFHDTGALPHCDGLETRARFHEVQVALLVEWLERAA